MEFGEWFRRFWNLKTVKVIAFIIISAGPFHSKKYIYTSNIFIALLLYNEQWLGCRLRVSWCDCMVISYCLIVEITMIFIIWFFNSVLIWWMLFNRFDDVISCVLGILFSTIILLYKTRFISFICLEKCLKLLLAFCDLRFRA